MSKQRKKSQKKKRSIKAGRPAIKSTPLFQLGQSQTQVLNETLKECSKRFKQLFFKGEYNAALKEAMAAHKLIPKQANILADIATCYLKLEQWQESIAWGLKAVEIDPNNMHVNDTLSHAYGAIGNKASAKPYGLKALMIRDAKYGSSPVPVINPPALPPHPSLDTKHKNIISFSLYGNLPKYCETAVLNATKARDVYSYWTCRFYVDSNVPKHVLARLEALNAQVILKDNNNAYPPTLWRFLALDDESLDRVICRDADSLVSEAEASAVEEWVKSDKLFHTMRDWTTHTELVLAGMWGAVQGALTTEKSIEQQILDFMRAQANIEMHFADQYFLREALWKRIKTSLQTHDSLYGFMDAPDFPIKTREKGSHIGSNVANSLFAKQVTVQDGEKITWKLVDNSGNAICDYPAIVKDGKISAHLPKKLCKQIEEGKLLVMTD